MQSLVNHDHTSSRVLWKYTNRKWASHRAEPHIYAFIAILPVDSFESAEPAWKLSLTYFLVVTTIFRLSLGWINFSRVSRVVFGSGMCPTMVPVWSRGGRGGVVVGRV